jgi:glutathione S-transferase
MPELYYAPGNASLFPHMLLREIGAPFELKLVDRSRNAQKSAAYLRLNPHGLIPVMVEDNGEAIFETAAIALHLADKHPKAHLAPLVGAPLRGAYYKWMLHLSSVIQAGFRTWFYPHEAVADAAAADTAKDASGARMMAAFDRIAEQLGAGPYLLGESFSAPDLYLLMLTRWGRTLPRPARDIPEVGAHAERVLARPAVQAALAAEGLAAPFV